MDNNFDITLRILTQQVGSEKAQEILKQVKEESAKAGDAGVKAEEEVAAATKKTFTSKKELKDMVKQLGNEFPMLGQLGRLALNPILLTVAAITGAVVIWKTRMAELQKSLGGVEMPDVSEGALERVERMAAAYGKAADHTKQINDNLTNITSQIDADERIAKALGFDPGTAPARDRAAATAATASALFASGKAKMADGADISDADLARLKANADAGAATLEELKSRQTFLGKFTSGEGTNMPEKLQFMMRYGNTATVEEAQQMDAARAESAQADLTRYFTALRRKELFNQGRDELKQSESLIGQNIGNVTEIAVGEASKLKAMSDKLASTDPLMLANAIIAIGTQFQEAMKASELVKSEIAARQRVQSQQQ